MKYKSVIIILFIVAGLAIFGINHSRSQSQPKRYVIKLYSGDQLVATWESFDLGSVNDNNTLLFNVGDRKYPRRVRISGTYSVEEFDQ
jgi:hypothetical protein